MKRKEVETFGKAFSYSSLKEQRIEVKKWAKENLVGQQINVPGIERPVKLTMNGIKEAINQPHKFIEEKNNAIRNIIELLKKAKFIKPMAHVLGDTNFLYYYLQIELNGEISYIVLRETLKEGQITFYTIIDKIKE